MSDVLKRFRCLGLMDPTDQEVRPQPRLAPRLTEGRGTVGGFLDNRKHNASVVLDHLATRLAAPMAWLRPCIAPNSSIRASLSLQSSTN